MEMGIAETGENGFAVSVDDKCLVDLLFQNGFVVAHVNETTVGDGDGAGRGPGGVAGPDAGVVDDEVSGARGLLSWGWLKKGTFYFSGRRRLKK